MARVKISEILEHLSVQVRGALDDALSRAAPDIQVDRAQVYREFRRSLAARCKLWERVPDGAVDAE